MAFPIIAAWPEPMLGKKLQRGAERIAPKIGRFNLSLGFVIICLGIFVLFFRERIIFDAPNKPVNNGRRG